jgi:hypothetical protein
MPFGDTLSKLGAATLANGDGFSGLLKGGLGTIMNSPIAQKVMGAAQGIIGGVQDKIGGIAGNLKGIVGKVSGMMQGAATGNASGIMGSLSKLFNKSGFASKATGFIDKLAGNLTGAIDKNLNLAALVNKGSETLAAKLSAKLNTSSFGQSLGNMQGLLGNVQAFAAEAGKQPADFQKLIANAQTTMDKGGIKNTLQGLLGNVDLSKFRVSLTSKVASIKNDKLREAAEKAITKLPPDQKVKEEIMKWAESVMK